MITEHDLAVILRTFWITLKAIEAASEPLEQEYLQASSKMALSSKLKSTSPAP